MELLSKITQQPFELYPSVTWRHPIDATQFQWFNQICGQCLFYVDSKDIWKICSTHNESVISKKQLGTKCSKWILAWKNVSLEARPCFTCTQHWTILQTNFSQHIHIQLIKHESFHSIVFGSCVCAWFCFESLALCFRDSVDLAFQNFALLSISDAQFHLNWGLIRAHSLKHVYIFCSSSIQICRWALNVIFYLYISLFERSLNYFQLISLSARLNLWTSSSRQKKTHIW